MTEYAHLGNYSDWVGASIAPRAWTQRPDPASVGRVVRDVLAVPDEPELPSDVRVERRFARDGVDGEELSYRVGFGPRTHAWLLKPAGATEPLPGVLGLHGHDGFKFYGKEKIADGPEPTAESVRAMRATHYEGTAFANDLAREGFAVLVPDVFGWGSRRFPLEQMPPIIRELGDLSSGVIPPDPLGGPADEVAHYNATAWHHELLLEKYCVVLGTTFAAMVAREDRIALAYLRGRPDVTDRTGAVGLSGGGCRAALLRAAADGLAASVVVGMMSTYEALLDSCVVNHTWMLFPPGLAGRADWPDLAACRAPAPLMVQYNRADSLFPLAGAEAAHERIAAHYAHAPESYTGRFYDGPHKFDREMQRDAFGWLAERLRG